MRVPGARQVALNEAAERMTAMAELARRFPAGAHRFLRRHRHAVLRRRAGSRASPRACSRASASRSRASARGQVAQHARERAFTKELVQPKPGERWLLVTSAHHMPRAVGVFRAAGFPVEAYPVDFRTRGAVDLLRPFSTLGDGLRRTDTAIREWVGLLVYRMTGQTAELFPAP